MKSTRLPFALLLIAALAFGACSSKQKPVVDSEARQQVNIPVAEQQSGTIVPVDVPADKLPDLSGLTDVEAQIFKRSVGLQIPYYDAKFKWAEHANTITKGEEAAASIREYLKIDDEFERSMQRLDLEFVGKIDPNYVPSKAFDKAIDDYMKEADLVRRMEYVTNSFSSIMKRFKDDPACQKVLAEIEKIASQPR
ncbi:MAG: hypothetical protein WBQ23_12980 [Bacteroidota bacterium]